MSALIVVDEHLPYDDVNQALRNWITAEQIGVELRGAKGLSDEQIPSLLRHLKRRTFITIDKVFYNRKLCDNAYCLIYFHLAMEQQNQIPILLRRLFRIEGFRSVQERMGKVIHVSSEQIRYYQRHMTGEQYLAWPV